MPPKFKFQEGDKVLCFHGPMLYEAKCIKAEQTNKLVKYFVHYQGWNKSWDEWVPEDRVLKYNEANVKRQQELFAQQRAQNKGRSGGKSKKSVPGKSKEGSDRDTSSPLPDLPPTKGAKTKSSSLSEGGTKEGGPARKRSKQDPTVESQEVYETKVEVKIKIPEEIKSWLVDDWDFITRQKKLVEIPAKQTVDQILDDYVKQKKAQKTKQPADTVSKECALNEIANGIREYFNTMLGCQLLYKFERAQYQKVYKENEDKPMSSIYGGVHLARLFVKLGQALAYTALNKEDLNTLTVHLQDFMKFMIKTQVVTAADYTTASAEYQRKAL